MCSVVLLRTNRDVESPDLCRIAGDLESSLSERSAHLLVGQHADDMSHLLVECCRRDAVQGRLAAAKFTEGPAPSRVLALREGEVLELSLRGNIEFDAGADQLSPWPRRFVYNSNLTSLATELFIREVSQFAQSAFDSYHGYVRLRLVDRPYQPPPKLAALVSQSVRNNKKSMAALGSKAVAAATDRNLVCEVLISLPKVSFYSHSGRASRYFEGYNVETLTVKTCH